MGQAGAAGAGSADEADDTLSDTDSDCCSTMESGSIQNPRAGAPTPVLSIQAIY
jgi:hypothetical protein